MGMGTVRPGRAGYIIPEHLLELINALEQEGTRVIIATHANRFRDIPTAGDEAYMVGWIRFYPRASGEALLDMEQKETRRFGNSPENIT